MNHQYEILKNGVRYAYTRPPFDEDDDLHCEAIVQWLKSGKLCVVGKVAQISNMGFVDMDILDTIEFVDEVDQISLIISHPSVLTIKPSDDEWSFRIMVNEKK